MELKSALDFRDEMIRSYYENEIRLDPDEGVRAQGASVLQYPGQRIAMGARFVSKGNWKVAIRVQAQNGKGMSYARKIIEKHKIESEVDLAIVQARTPARGHLIAAGGNAVATSGSGGSGVACETRRPPEIGYSIGHLDGGPGTLGLFAQRDGDAVGLSCNHVLALANSATRGDDVFQAGPPDSRPLADDLLGKLGDFEFLKRNGSNTIDAAYCKIQHDSLPISNALPHWAGSHAGNVLGNPISTDELVDILSEEDARVAKAGKRTLLTSAPAQNVVVGVNDITVLVSPLGNCRFDNVIEIEADAGSNCFSDVGDSGSAVFASNTYSPFGLIFAGGTTSRTGVERVVSYACSLNEVFHAYRLETWT